MTAVVSAGASPDPNSEEVDKLLNELREATRRAGIQRDDPMMPLLTAMAHSIRFLGDRTSRSDRVSQDASQRIIDALAQGRQTADAELARFEAGLTKTEADIIQRVGTSIARSADTALTRRVKVFDRNTAMAAAGFLFAVGAACLGGGYWWGHYNASTNIQQIEQGLQSAFADDPATAKMWLNLMQWNDLRDALHQCSDPNYSAIEHGRRECTLPFWIEAAPTTVPDHRQ